MMKSNQLYNKCLNFAQSLIDNDYPIGNVSLLELTETIYKLELEKIEKNNKTDELIEYNNEIVSIEEVGLLETVDISVSGDNLFYCNGILTKNSFGLPATVDLMFALIATEELDELNQLMVKQLKNRYNDPSYCRRFIIGVDKAKMRLYDVDLSAQNDIMDGPVMDNTEFGKNDSDRSKPSFNFGDFR